MKVSLWTSEPQHRELTDMWAHGRAPNQQLFPSVRQRRKWRPQEAVEGELGLIPEEWLQGTYP